MPEPWTVSEEEQDYLDAVERVTETKLDNFQVVRLVELYRANKNGTQFKLGRKFPSKRGF